MTRVVYGARCVWWDTIDKTARTPPEDGVSIPCCPHCGSVLFEVESEQEFLGAADKYEAKGHPGYRSMLEWSRGKCFPTWSKLRLAYSAETGRVAP